jgi:starch synthase
MNLRILMITSELYPIAKAGGLADAVADLSLALAERGHDVRALLPRYYFSDRASLHRLPSDIELEPEGRIAMYETYVARGQTAVTVYLADYEAAYGRDGIYGTDGSTPFEDNAWRFSLLARLAPALCRSLGWKPQAFHAHDWPAALTPLHLGQEPHARWFDGSLSVFTIHNFGYQGIFPFADAAGLGLEPETVLSSGLVQGRHLNFLRAAITAADVLTTVSPGYAREISRPDAGHGLEGALTERSGELIGILNGIDNQRWDPATDPLIPFQYDENSLDTKRLLKRVLRWHLGLRQDDELPLIGMVTRLVGQKGFDELLSRDDPALLRILNRTRCQVAILGTGPEDTERTLTDLASDLDNLSVTIGYDDRLAHLIEAGSDFFLMPSRYEPCGLNQMYSMRYGTVPIATNTGGLADTIVDIREDEQGGTGYLIPRCESAAIYATVKQALDDRLERPERVRAARVAGMAKRFGWEYAAARYEALYLDALDASS